MVLARLPLIVTGRNLNSMQVNDEWEVHLLPLYFHNIAAGFVVVAVDIAAVAAEEGGHEDRLVEVQDMAVGLVLLLEANNLVEAVTKPVQSFVVAVSGFVGIHLTYRLHFAYPQKIDIALLVVEAAVVEAHLLTC